MQVLYVSNKFEGKFLRFSDFEYVRDKRSYIQNAVYAYTTVSQKRRHYILVHIFAKY